MNKKFFAFALSECLQRRGTMASTNRDPAKLASTVERSRAACTDSGFGFAAGGDQFG